MKYRLTVDFETDPENSAVLLDILKIHFFSIPELGLKKAELVTLTDLTEALNTEPDDYSGAP